jgi:protein SCO1/2
LKHVRPIIASMLFAWLWMGASIASGAALADTGVFQHGEAPMDGAGGALDLVTQAGKPFALTDLRGEQTLLFFGFTRCGNTCPLAMAQARQVLANFHAGRPPQVVFVTLDPLSDPPAALSAYLSQFDKRIIGLTGSPVQTEAAARRYGVGVNKSAGPLEHSSRWYLLDDNARLVRVYKIDTPVSAMVQDMLRARTHRMASVWRKGAP